MWQENFKFLNFPKNVRVKSAEVVENLMDERNITLQVEYCDNESLSYSDDLRLTYKGETYIMSTRLPRASQSRDCMQVPMEWVFEHQTQYWLKQYYFVTLQQLGSGTAVKDKYLASVSLNLGDFVNLLAQECQMYFGSDVKVYIHSTAASTYDRTPTFVEISYAKIWDVLTKLYETYNVSWYIRGNGIYIGYPLTEVNHIFQYGHEGGLTSVEREIQSNELCNVLLGRGGEKNLPYRYFKNVDSNNPTFAADPDWIPELKDMYFDVLRGATFRSYIQGYNTYKYGWTTVNSAAKAYSAEAWRQGREDAANNKFDPWEFVKDKESIAIYGERWGCLENNEDFYPTIEGMPGGLDEVVDVEQIKSDDYEAEAESSLTFTDLDVSTMVATKDVPADATIDITTNQRYYFKTEKGLTNLRLEMAIMKVRDLETNKTSDNIADVRISKYTVNVYKMSNPTEAIPPVGLVEGEYFFDYHIEVENLHTDKAFSVTAGVARGRLQNTSAEKGFAQTFDVWIKNIWGDNRDAFGGNDEEFAHEVWDKILGDRLGNQAKVIFKTGFLSVSEDYEFVITETPQYDDTRVDDNGNKSFWRLTLAKSDADLETLGVYVPSVQRQGASGDKFAFIGIDMPHEYVVKAEEALDDYKKQVLNKKAQLKETYNLGLDRIRLQEPTSSTDTNPLIKYLQVGSSLRLRTDAIDNKGVPSEGAYKVLYIQSMTTTYREATSEDAALNPDVEITVSDEYETTANAVATIKEEISSLKQRLNTYNIEQIVRAVGDKLYLRKDGISDISKSPTEFSSLVTSGNFRAGLVGGAGWGFYRDTNGRAVLEADVVNVREELAANTFVINQVEARTGMIIESAAAMTVNSVSLVNGHYTLTFDQKNGSIGNGFRFEDIIYCSRFNPDNSTQKSYKAVVWELGVNSITIYDEDIVGNGVPEVGDVVIQYGNIDDANRQYIKVRDVVGGGYERYIEGLSSVGATGTEYYYVGRQIGKQPRWFIGREREQYAKWENGVLTIKGTILAESQINGQALPDYFKGLIPEITQSDIEDFVNNIVNPQIDNIQNQIDGVIETWFIETTPTLDNYPASEWTTTSLKEQHVGDLCYDNSTGGAYRFTKSTDGKTYYWNVITDQAIAEALAAAKNAQDTADGKRRVFVDVPYTPYEVGDLWANGTFLKRCMRSRLTGGFDQSDWANATGYTGDENLNKFISAVYNSDMADIRNQIDGKIEVWYQNDDPSREWTTKEEKAKHVGDQWYVLNTKQLYRYASTYEWVRIQDQDAIAAAEAASRAQDTADGKRRVFVNQPTTPYDVGDLWADGVSLKRCMTARATGNFVASDWQDATNYTSDENLNNFIDNVFYSQVDEIYNQIDGKIEVWYQPSTNNPADNWSTDEERRKHVGDQWYKTDLKRLFHYVETSTGFVWQEITNQDAIDAIAAAATAKDTADGKRRVFVQQPTTPYDVGDLWVNATYQNKYSNDTLVCISAKDEKGNFSIDDWQKASKYTDDTTANQALDAIADYSYLKEALANDTLISGGLLMTSLISLGYDDDFGRHNMAGINGIYTNSNSIASWWGGSMIDRLLDGSNPGIANAATALIRMDGSGYFAKGGITWEADGSGSVANGNITWTKLGNVTLGNGVAITLGDGSNKGLSDTLTSIMQFLSGFGSMITPMDSSGKELAWANADKAAALRISKALYSVEDVSAFGNGSGSGSGGSGGASALSQLVDVQLASLSKGQYLRYNGTHWINVSLTIPTKTSQLTNDSGFLTKHQPLDEYLKTAIAEATYAKKGEVVSSVALNADNDIVVTKNGHNVLSNLRAKRLGVYDTRDVADEPQDFSVGFVADFKRKTTINLTDSDAFSFTGVLSMQSYADYSVGYPVQMALTQYPHLFLRKGTAADTWSDWVRVAMVTDNVASATKLATARTLWGQSFDGTANVSGNINVGGEMQNVTKVRLQNGPYYFGSNDYCEFMSYGGESRPRLLVGKLIAAEALDTATDTSVNLFVAGNSKLKGNLTLAGHIYDASSLRLKDGAIYTGGTDWCQFATSDSSARARILAGKLFAVEDLTATMNTNYNLYISGTSYLGGNLTMDGHILNASSLRLKNSGVIYSGGADYCIFSKGDNSARARLMAGKLFAVEDKSTTINTNYALYVAGNSYLSGSVKIGDATLTWDSENQCLVCDKPIVGLNDITAFKS